MLFKKHPIVANCTIYGALYTSADLMQQLVSKYFIEVSNNWVSRQVKSHQTNFLLIFQAAPNKEIDYKVIRRLAFMGTFVYGPTLYAWFVTQIGIALAVYITDTFIDALYEHTAA